MTSNLIRNEWERKPTNPDLKRDLGYEMLDWEVIQSEQGNRKLLLFLPSDKDMLKDNAFMVVESSGVCELDGMC